LFLLPTSFFRLWSIKLGRVILQFMRIEKLVLPTPFPVGPINIYLLVDDPLTLVDTGPKTDAAIEALTTQIKQLGFRLEDIKRIILTHTHEDHCGLAGWLQQRCGARVYVHEWEQENLTNHGRLRADRALLQSAGVPAEELEQMVGHYAQVKSYADAVEDVATYRDEHEFEFATGSWRVVHTPGHTPGSSCLLRAATRTLLAGDTVLKLITPNPVMNPDPRQPARRFPALKNYLASLEKLRALALTLIHTSHGDVVTDYEEYLARLRRHTYERQTKVLRMIPDKGIAAYELAHLLFPKVKDITRFLAVSEAVAHLDLAVGWHGCISHCVKLPTFNTRK
jgi:glyoxylase-like metal-dependent hydrolase (beta-lactamase superfamily II)